MVERPRPTPSQDKASYFRHPILASRLVINTHQILRASNGFNRANRRASLSHVPQEVRSSASKEAILLKKRLDSLHKTRDHLSTTLFQRGTKLR